MITPPYLKPGDTIGILCTARSFTTEAAQPAIQLAQQWGLNVVLGKTIDINVNQLGGTDAQRADDLQSMLDNPNISAIWIARGGYGTVRIIDQIDFTHLLKHPKWIIGFSDITVLHSHIHTLGISTLHAIMPFSVPNATIEAKETLHHALFGKKYAIQTASDASNKPGVCNGTLVGGNLSILYSLLGSPSSIDTKDKILYLEDLDEYLYHIDRMFYNLKRNGYFNDLKGLIIGSMTDMHDNQIPFGNDVKQIVLEITKSFDFPICFDFPAGHIANNQALKLGTEIRLTIDNENTILNYV